MTAYAPHWYFSFMGKLKSIEPDRDDVAGRILRVRKATGLDQAEFAEKTGIAKNTYNQWEKGKRIPELKVAMALCQAWGITLDFLYRGEWHGLPEATNAALTGLRPTGDKTPLPRVRRPLVGRVGE